MRRILAIVAKEIREALPATIFFLLLFHLIGLTKAVVLDEYSLSALRAMGATMGALIVAKAVLVVEALSIARLFSGRRISNILWRTLLYGALTLIFRFVEEFIPLVSKHGEIVSAIRGMIGEVSWPLFAVLSLWIFSGLFFYTLVSDMVKMVEPNKIKDALFSRLNS
ncbi:hypothetical protein SAMN05421830_106208 [Desulfomicrobium norvegicum]|uniref:Uncharacterized protein n=1 Tax=Desulfomicrobium norvegicum (strain DSM 1741 / NCIMB 8310) TaxID=52561 RepID=A0A8G2C440_DESNO|nr:hypothetical protein [Desulfomicrobium norvegicum]SFL80051.1 hypothetical protein SAMN05421830_106208 [Desulfomicrobium norvegicum]